MKGKLKVWLLIIGLCFVFTYGKDFIIQYFSDNTSHKTIATETFDNNLNLKVSDKYNNLTFKAINNINDSDYIITNHANENLYPEYLKLDSYLYSPFIFIGNYDIKKDIEGLISNNKKKDSRFSKDLAYFILGIESDLTWSQIGITNKNISNKNKDEKINIIIPNKRSPYYEYIKNLFILCLNDFKEPTDDEYKSLLPRVINILDKCEKVEDVGQYLYNKYNEGKRNPLNGLVLAPESVISDSKESFNTSYLGGFNYSIITPTITTAIYYDVYVRENVSEGLNNLELFKDLVNNEDDFIIRTGLRSCEMDLGVLENKYHKGVLLNLKVINYNLTDFKDKYNDYENEIVKFQKELLEYDKYLNYNYSILDKENTKQNNSENFESDSLEENKEELKDFIDESEDTKIEESEVEEVEKSEKNNTSMILIIFGIFAFFVFIIFLAEL